MNSGNGSNNAPDRNDTDYLDQVRAVHKEKARTPEGRRQLWQLMLKQAERQLSQEDPSPDDLHPAVVEAMLACLQMHPSQVGRGDDASNSDSSIASELASGVFGELQSVVAEVPSSPRDLERQSVLAIIEGEYGDALAQKYLPNDRDNYYTALDQTHIEWRARIMPEMLADVLVELARCYSEQAASPLPTEQVVRTFFAGMADVSNSRDFIDGTYPDLRGAFDDARFVEIAQFGQFMQFMLLKHKMHINEYNNGDFDFAIKERLNGNPQLQTLACKVFNRVQIDRGVRQGDFIDSRNVEVRAERLGLVKGENMRLMGNAEITTELERLMAAAQLDEALMVRYRAVTTELAELGMVEKSPRLQRAFGYQVQGSWAQERNMTWVFPLPAEKADPKATAVLLLDHLEEWCRVQKLAIAAIETEADELAKSYSHQFAVKVDGGELNGEQMDGINQTINERWLVARLEAEMQTRRFNATATDYFDALQVMSREATKLVEAKPTLPRFSTGSAKKEIASNYLRQASLVVGEFRQNRDLIFDNFARPNEDSVYSRTDGLADIEYIKPISSDVPSLKSVIDRLDYYNYLRHQNRFDCQVDPNSEAIRLVTITDAECQDLVNAGDFAELDLLDGFLDKVPKKIMEDADKYKKRADIKYLIQTPTRELDNCADALNEANCLINEGKYAEAIDAVHDALEVLGASLAVGGKIDFREMTLLNTYDDDRNLTMVKLAFTNDQGEEKDYMALNL